MSQMSPTNNNLTKLDMNPGHMVHLVPDWMDCRVDYDFL